MSSNEDEGSDADTEPFLSPSALLQAPSSQPVIEDVNLNISRSAGSADELDTGSEGDEDVSDYGLETRFVGPASTWQRYTADERALAVSLEQQRAKDLSAHLYNAHALKTRLYDQNVANEAKPWQSKQHWIKLEDDQSLPWQPDQNWTAWPLPAADVPRKSEVFGKALLDDGADSQTWQKPTSWKPSGDLEDELQALMLQKAKERFRGRMWDTIQPDKCSQLIHSRSRSASRSRSCRPSRPPSSRTSSASADRLNQKPHDLIETGSKVEPPTFMADDEEANRLLVPSIRHVVSKVDELLTALHHSRQGHHPTSVTPIETGFKPAVQKRKRSRTTEEASEKASVNTSTTMRRKTGTKRTMTADRDYIKHPSGSHTLRTRDWSEVLGVASLAGWDPVVIERAATRCASLFGETMSFRAMPETAVGAAADMHVEYRPDTTRDVNLASDEDGFDLDEAELEGFACPEQSCARHHQSFEKRWRLHEHLKKKHGYSRDDMQDFLHAHNTNALEPTVAREVPEQSGPGNAIESSGQNGLCGGVHEDGFLQPVSVKLRRGKDLQPRGRKRSRVLVEASEERRRRSISAAEEQLARAGTGNL